MISVPFEKAAAALSTTKGKYGAALTTQVQSIAKRAGCTEGQVYSMVIGLTAALTLALGGTVPLGSAPAVAAANPVSGLVEVPPAVPDNTVAPGDDLPAPIDTGVPPLDTSLPPLDAGPLGVDPAPLDPGPDPTPDPGPSQPPTVDLQDFQVPTPGSPAAIVSNSKKVIVGTDNADSSPSRLVLFSRKDAKTKSFSITGQPETRSGGLSAAAIIDGKVVAADRSRGALIEIDPASGNQKVLVELPDLPACAIGLSGVCQPGVIDVAPSPEGIAVSDEFIYISDAGQGVIWRYSIKDKSIADWYLSSDFAAGGGPSGLALNSDGDLIFSVAQAADAEAALAGALYKLSITVDGVAGTRTLLASFEQGSAPGPIAVGGSGNIYVGLRSAGGIKVVDSAGTISDLSGGDRTTSPRGLSLAKGVLYVADPGSPATAASGAVLALAVDDAPF
jgi:hypothetical protein